MRLFTGDDLLTHFQPLVVRLKQNHVFSCALFLKWDSDSTAPWLADKTLQRLLEMHLTKALAGEHEKTSLLFFQNGNALMLGEGLGNAAYLRALASLEDEVVKLGVHPAQFHVQAFDLSVDWDAFMTQCRELNTAEKTAAATRPSAQPAVAKSDPAQLIQHLHDELTLSAKVFSERPIPGNRKLNLLFVEDEPSIRQLLSALLADSGHNLTFAANAREAVYAYCRKPPHIVFLDINLPDLSGLQVLEFLRQHDPHVFAVMLTSHAASDHVQNAVKNGVRHYIVKPFSRQKLQESLERFFAGH